MLVYFLIWANTSKIILVWVSLPHPINSIIGSRGDFFQKETESLSLSCCSKMQEETKERQKCKRTSTVNWKFKNLIFFLDFPSRSLLHVSSDLIKLFPNSSSRCSINNWSYYWKQHQQVKKSKPESDSPSQQHAACVAFYQQWKKNLV